MNLTTLLSITILLATNIIMLTLTKDDLLFKSKIWIAKKITRKPIMEVNLYRSDKTIKHAAITPDTRDRTIEIENDKYMYTPESLNHNPEHQVQSIVLKQGCVNAINTQKWEPGEVDPQRIAVAIKVAKQRGREEADQSFENYKKYLYIILGITGITLALTLLTLQNTDAIQGTLQTLATLIQNIDTKPIILNGSQIT